MLSGCAAQADRTRALLELDLADRGRAISRLEAEYQREPAAWRAYSLGVLHGADGDYPGMHRWFDQCSDLTNLYDQKIVRTVGEHWRDQARRADDAMAEGRWSTAVEACEQALLADPSRSETRLRLIEARTMAFGPELEEIRRLAAAGRTAVLDNWLAEAAEPDNAESRLAVRVRLQTQLGTASAEPSPGDAFAAFIVAELARLDEDWAVMDQWYRRAESQTVVATEGAIARTSDHRPLIKARRRTVADRYLTRALAAWGDLHVRRAIACIDTAELADPGRADIVKVRGNIELLAGASTTESVRTALALGDLDADWLALWMTQLYNRDRREDAALVADALLSGSAAATSKARRHALRLRANWRLESGDLAGASADLRALLESGHTDAHTAVVLGDVLTSLSAYAEARHWYDKAADWNGGSAELDARRARTAFSQGLIDDMLRFSEQALAAAPDNNDYQRLVQRARDLTEEVRP